MSTESFVKELRSLLNKHMKERYGCMVIFADTNADAPPKPYVTLKLSQIRPETFNERHDEFYSDGGTDSYRKGWHKRKSVYEQLPLMFTVYTKSDMTGVNLEAMMLGQALQDWFSTYGERFLERSETAVVSTSALMDKSVHFIDSYDYKTGFDVTLRRTHHKIEVPLYQDVTNDYNYDIINTVIVTNARTGDKVTVKLEGGDKRD